MPKTLVPVVSSWFTRDGCVYRGWAADHPAPKPRGKRRAYRCAACGGLGHNIKSCRSADALDA